MSSGLSTVVPIRMSFQMIRSVPSEQQIRYRGSIRMSLISNTIEQQIRYRGPIEGDFQ